MNAALNFLKLKRKGHRSQHMSRNHFRYCVFNVHVCEILRLLITIQQRSLVNCEQFAEPNFVHIKILCNDICQIYLMTIEFSKYSTCQILILCMCYAKI